MLRVGGEKELMALQVSTWRWRVEGCLFLLGYLSLFLRVCVRYLQFIRTVTAACAMVTEETQMWRLPSKKNIRTLIEEAC